MKTASKFIIMAVLVVAVALPAWAAPKVKTADVNVVKSAEPNIPAKALENKAKAAQHHADAKVKNAKKAADKTADAIANEANAPGKSAEHKVKAKVAVAEKAAAKAGFVASKDGAAFHKATCSAAKRIKAENLVTYATKDEAVAAGKTPCKKCNP